MSQNSQAHHSFVEVIIPVPIEKAYTYSVPEAFRPRIQTGVRVEVQFGKSKHYAAVVVGSSDKAPEYRTKDIIDIIDDEPLIDDRQYAFWQWVADYYCCSVGEVMNAALPSGFKLASESMICLNPDADRKNRAGTGNRIILSGELS